MRLIDADALLNLPFEKMIHTDYGDTCVPIEEIEMAPTVEPEPVSEYQKRALAIVDALTEKHLINVRERGCLRRSILLEPERPQDKPKTVQDCIIAYGDGFESAR